MPSPTDETPSSNTSGRQALRRRRNQVTSGVQRMEQDERKMHRSLSAHHAMSAKVYFMGFSVMLLLILPLALYMEPRIWTVFWKRRRRNKDGGTGSAQKLNKNKQWRLVSVFPDNVSPIRDLPLVVGSYAIKTPQNEPAREAIKYFHQQRQTLRSRAYKLVWSVMEQTDFEWFAQRSRGNNTCGQDFADIYSVSSTFVKRDLVFSCWLQSKRIQGVLPFGVEFHRAIPSSYDNLAVQYYSEDIEDENELGSRAMMSSLLLINDPSHSKVASHWYDWLVTESRAGQMGDDEGAYREKLDRKLHEWIRGETSSPTTQWNILDAVCDDDRIGYNVSNRRMLATLCSPDSIQCCDIWDLTRAKSWTEESVWESLGKRDVDEVSSLRRRR